MEFVRIFGEENSLLSVIYDNEKIDAFAQIFDQWTDIEYLEYFFSKNEDDLARPYWKGISVEQAVIETRKEAVKFRKHLLGISQKPENERKSLFLSFFKPLNNKDIRHSFPDKKKAYGLNYRTWLRIYALKIGDDMYIITGGAIKLTDNMGERPHTAKELQKLNKCKEFLLDEHIIDEDSMIELLEL